MGVYCGSTLLGAVRMGACLCFDELRFCQQLLSRCLRQLGKLIYDPIALLLASRLNYILTPGIVPVVFGVDLQCVAKLDMVAISWFLLLAVCIPEGIGLYS